MRNKTTLAVFLLLATWNASEAGLLQRLLKNKNKDRVSNPPRRRLTDVHQVIVDTDAATGTVRIDNEEKSDCDRQLAQALVTANDAEVNVRRERDAALEQKAAALAQIEQLESQVQELQGTIRELQSNHESEIQALKTQLAEASSEGMAAVAAAEKVKDSIIENLKAQLEDDKGDLLKQMEAQIEEMKVKIERQLKEKEELVEATQQEAKRVLVEKVSTVKEQMKLVESQAEAALAKKEADLKEIKAQYEQISKYNAEVLEANQAYDQVCICHISTHFGVSVLGRKK